MIIDRHRFAQEMLLREQIRNNIKELITEEKDKLLKEEKKLRSVIRGLLTEEQSTSINFLENLFSDTNLVSTLQDGYESLEKEEEKKSYKSHTLSSLMKTLDIYDTNNISSDVEEAPLEEEVEIEVEDDPDRLLGQEEEKVDDSAITDFTLAGENETGRNLALGVPGERDKGVVDIIWPSIRNWYSKIGTDDAEGREVFKDYLLINIKKYFGLWDSESDSDIEEPTIEEPEDMVEPGLEASEEPLDEPVEDASEFDDLNL